MKSTMWDLRTHSMHHSYPAVCALMLASSWVLAGAEQPSWWNSQTQPVATPKQGITRNQHGGDSDSDSWYPHDETQETWPKTDQFSYVEGSGYPQASPNPEEIWGGWGEEEDLMGGAERKVGRDAVRKSRRRGRRRTRLDGEGEGNTDDVELDEGAKPIGKDLVQEYVRSFKGRTVLSGSASVVGAALAAIISKSTIQRTPTMSLVGLLLGLVLSVAKGAFGDLFRAMGLALVLAIRRSQRLSVEYPFLPYARRALAMAPRRPFPPAENPWRYRREDALALAEEPDVEDGVLPPEFSMAQSLLAVAFLGAFTGYLVSQFVFLPTFLLALGFGGSSAYAATMRSSRGDLARLVGMHTVAFLGLVGEINSDVGLSRKGRVVGGICFSKAMFWDSKYRIKDRAMVVLSNLYTALITVVGKLQRDAGAGGDNDEYINEENIMVDDISAPAGGRANEEGFFPQGDRRQRDPTRNRRRRRSDYNDDGGDGDDARMTSSSQPPPPPPPPQEYGGGSEGGNSARDFF